MKKFIALSLISLSLVAGSAMADSSKTLAVSGLDKGIYGLMGEYFVGEIKVTPSGFNNNISFNTFCVEIKENVYVPSTNNYVQLNTAAIQGGGGSVNGSDPLSFETAWLYNKYLTGGFGTMTNQIAADIQLAVWALEDEIDVNSLSTYGKNASQYYHDAQNSHATSLGNIRLMNLYANPNLTGYRQDLLVAVPTVPGQIVPAPGAIVLGMMGMGLVGWIKRKVA